MVPGRGHDHGREDVRRLDPERLVGRHHPARDVGHARGHHREQLRPRQPRQVRPDRQRGLGLTQEQRRGDVELLGTARPHQPRHDPGEAPTIHCITPR